MCEVVKVLERELENSGLIYVYQEGGEGKWYVYERSAYSVSYTHLTLPTNSRV